LRRVQTGATILARHMTAPKLAVILGAGASHDVCREPSCLGEPTWQPPLVSNLFASRPFNNLLNSHLEAATILNDLRVEMGSPDANFEVALRNRWESTDPHIRHLMRFVPIALQQFFNKVSQHYTLQPVNYSALVARTVGHGLHTAFITVNYDTILEKVLVHFRLQEDQIALKGISPEFDSMESYISYPRWLLVKLHGSANWGYRWKPPDDLLQLARKYEPPHPDRNAIEFVADPASFRDSSDAFYPALALPVAGKYGFVCPTAHEEELKSFLTHCRFFLFIGFSAKDQDLLDLLSTTVTQAERLVVVSGKDAEEVKQRLLSVRRFAAIASFRPNTLTYSNGFGSFVADGLDELIDSVSASDR